MPNNANTPAPASAPATRAESVVVREMLIALTSRVGRHGLGDQRAAHAEIRGTHQSHQGRDDQHDQRRDDPGKREHQQRGGEHRVSRPHAEQQRL